MRHEPQERYKRYSPAARLGKENSDRRTIAWLTFTAELIKATYKAF